MTCSPILVALTLVFPSSIPRDGGAQTRAGRDTSTIVAASQRFELRSDPRVDLHHFLIAWASADAGEWPPYATPVVERETWRLLLDEEEQRAWSAALQAYNVAVDRSFVFDTGLVAVRDWAAGSRRARPYPRRTGGWPTPSTSWFTPTTWVPTRPAVA